MPNHYNPVRVPNVEFEGNDKNKQKMHFSYLDVKWHLSTPRTVTLFIAHFSSDSAFVAHEVGSHRIIFHIGRERCQSTLTAKAEKKKPDRYIGIAKTTSKHIKLVGIE